MPWMKIEQKGEIGNPRRCSEHREVLDIFAAPIRNDEGYQSSILHESLRVLGSSSVLN